MMMVIVVVINGQNIVDGSVCEKYINSSEDEQKRIAKEMNKSVNELKKAVLQISEVFRIC